MEKWLITYSRVVFSTFPKHSDNYQTVIYEGTLESFLEKETSKDSQGRREGTVVIHFAVKL